MHSQFVESFGVRFSSDNPGALPDLDEKLESSVSGLYVVGALAGLVVAGMLAPAELRDHLAGSSDRFLMQIAPIAVLFAAAQWATPLDDPEERPANGGYGDRS